MFMFVVKVKYWRGLGQGRESFSAVYCIRKTFLEALQVASKLKDCHLIWSEWTVVGMEHPAVSMWPEAEAGQYIAGATVLILMLSNLACEVK